MGSEWKETTLGEVVNFRRGHDLPKSKMVNGTIPVVGSNGVIGNHNASTTPAPCITIGRSGNVGKPHLSPVESWAHNTTLYIDDFKGNDPEFVFHFLKTLELESFRGGSAVPTLNRNHIHPIEVTLPPFPEQKAIAHILGTLDAKIELNRRMNATLEGMAQALFKSWFVDFDPVLDNAILAGNPIPEEFAERAKVRRKILEQNQNDECSVMNDELKDSSIQNSSLKTHHSPQAPALAAGNAIPDELASKAELRRMNAECQSSAIHHSSLSTHHSLFPAAFQETESMGWIPEGWESATLGDYLEIKRGGSPRPIHDFLRPEGLPWVKIADATASPSRFLFATKEFIKPEGLKKTILMKKGSLILSNSATPGLPMFLELDACIHDGWLHFPQKKHFGNLYLYQLFLVIREELVAQGNGSVFTNLKTDILRAQRIAVPPASILHIFEDWMEPHFDKIRAVNVGSRTLTKLRDTLLPKLISGELRLPEAKPLTEETAHA